MEKTQELSYMLSKKEMGFDTGLNFYVDRAERTVKTKPNRNKSEHFILIPFCWDTDNASCSDKTRKPSQLLLVLMIY